MPNSPKLTFVPPVAWPERPGWCCLRCLTLRGMSITTTVAATVVTTAGLLRRVGLLACELLVGEIALVDPDLHTDAAEGRLGLVEAVVDVRAERVQGHTAFAVELRAAHLGPAETAGHLDAHTLGAGALRALQALAHRAAERHTSRQLLR